MVFATMAKDQTAAAKRLSIPINDDGFIDMEHMRPSTAQALIDLIKTDPTIRDTYKEVNGPADVADVFGGITEANVAKGLDLVCSVNALVFRVAAKRFVKHPLLKDAASGKPLPLVIDQDVLDRAFALTSEQHAELDPRAARLAEKYSSAMPEWLKKNIDLYMFCSMFLAYTAQNAKAALETQVKRDLGRAQAAFAQQRAAQVKNPQPDSDAQPVNGHDRAAQRTEQPTQTIEPGWTAPPDAPTV